MALRIRKDDTVVVISGKDKGRRGRVLLVNVDRNRVIVEGVNVVKRHKKRVGNQAGSIVEKEASIHVSNVMLLDSKSDKPSRVRMGKDKDGRKVRIAVKNGTVIEQR
jgi:large subunit ribosomal protein L24